MRVSFLVSLAAMGVLSSAALAGPVLFDIRVLGLSGAGVSGQGRAISDDGRVAGIENIAGGFQRGSAWSAGSPSTATISGIPSYLPAVTSVENHGVNGSGTVVGVARYSAPPPGSTTGSAAYDRGVVFTAAGGRTVIEPFNSSGGRRAFAQAVNDRNRVVGNGSNDAVLTNQNPRRAFWYDADPTATGSSVYKLDGATNGLPFLPGGSWSLAYGINESQAIAGFAQAPDDGATPANRNRAVVWSAGTVDAAGNPYSTVTRLDGRNSASTSSLARDINDAGVVTGRMALSATFGDETGFVHRPGDTALTSLGLFGTTRTEALDIGENGWIVGYAGATEGDSSNNSRALVWFPQVGGVGGYQAFELLSLLDSSDPANGGWTKLLEARQVSADGTIAGYGRYVATPGGVEVTRGFVLTVVPEPGTLALVVPGLALLSRRRNG